jgi:hypothetical protein
MPIGFLTAAERERLDRFPDHIPDDDLFAYFRLSQADHDAVNKAFIENTCENRSQPANHLKITSCKC